MKYRYSLLAFLIAFILQTTVMNHFSIFQMSPNLILCLVVVYSFLYQGYHGMINGILFGLIIDVCFAEIIGIAALSNFIVSLICIELKRYLNKDSLISVVIASSVGTMAYSLIYWSIYKMLGNNYDLMYVMGKQAVLLIYHILVIAIIYQIISHSIIKHHGDRYMYRGSLQEARSLNRK